MQLCCARFTFTPIRSAMGALRWMGASAILLSFPRRGFFAAAFALAFLLHGGRRRHLSVGWVC